MIDPSAATSDAGVSENSEELIAKMKRTLDETDYGNTLIKMFKTATEEDIKKNVAKWKSGRGLNKKEIWKSIK